MPMNTQPSGLHTGIQLYMIYNIYRGIVEELKLSISFALTQ